MQIKKYLYRLLFLGTLFQKNTCFAQDPSNINLLLEKLEKYRSLPVKNYESDSAVTGVLAALGWAYRARNIDSAVYYLEEDLRLARKANFPRGLASAYNQMGALYRQTGDFEKANEYYKQALDIWRSFKKNNPVYYNSTIIINEGRTLNNMGTVYLEKGESSKALDLFFQALKIDESKGNRDGAANKLGNIGNAFKSQGQYDKALEYYVRVLKIDDSIGNKGRMAECYGNMGSIYRKKKDRNKAITYHFKAMELNKTTGDKSLLSENYLNIAEIYDEEKKDIEAEDYYNKSLQLKTATGDRHGIAIINQNMGAMYLDRNLLSEAENYLLNAKTVFDKIGAAEGQTELLRNLSRLYEKKGQYKEALKYQYQAETLKDSLFNAEKTAQLARMEADYENGKREAIAKAAYEKEIAIANTNKLRGIAEADKRRILAELNKSLVLAEAGKRIAATEANKRIAISDADNKRMLAEANGKQSEAEAEKKMAAYRAENEKQRLIRNVIISGTGIIILSSLLIFFIYKRKRDAVQKQNETALNLKVAETEMKSLRSQMNPHFIFNALQSVQTFLVNHKPDDANNYLLKFSKLMRLVLENSQYTEVPLKEDVQALELYMQLESIRLPYPFTYNIHIDKSLDPESDTILPLILQPFVENAIWHGLQYKPTAGNISISLSKKDNILNAVVIDNGVGRYHAERNRKPLFVKHESMGLKLTQDRLNTLNETKQVNACFTITDLLDAAGNPAGTKVELFLPLGG